MKEILENLWQFYGEDEFIEILSEFLTAKPSKTGEDDHIWTLLRVPQEFDPDIVIEVAYSCRNTK